MHDLAYVRPPCGLGQPHGTDDIDRRVELRVGHRLADVDLRGEMEHHLRLGFGEKPDQVGVDDIGLDELEVAMLLGAVEVRAAAGTEVVDADNDVRLRAGGLPALIR